MLKWIIVCLFADGVVKVQYYTIGDKLSVKQSLEREEVPTSHYPAPSDYVSQVSEGGQCGMKRGETMKVIILEIGTT